VSNLSNLVEEIIAEEEAVLANLQIEKFLAGFVSSSEGKKRFAEIFYFVRADFPTLNFIVGERCGNNDFLWAGLARNLVEELGGGTKQSHNQLYRNFLNCVGSKTELLGDEPDFSADFNQSWRIFCREAPLPEVLSAIAVYEIFDQPDYKLFLRVLTNADIPEVGLRFFQVHALAEHFDMFEDIVVWLREQPGGYEAFEAGRKFVIQTQQKMWLGLKHKLTDQNVVISA
jgi:pyrroloquinoline quinone (PQQ) biosynthesis protein C